MNMGWKFLEEFDLLSSDIYKIEEDTNEEILSPYADFPI